MCLKTIKKIEKDEEKKHNGKLTSSKKIRLLIMHRMSVLTRTACHGTASV